MKFLDEVFSISVLGITVIIVVTCQNNKKNKTEIVTTWPIGQVNVYFGQAFRKTHLPR